MKRLQRWMVAAACLSLVACEGTGDEAPSVPVLVDPVVPSSPEVPAPPAPSDTGKPPTRHAPGELEVRLLAVNPADYASLSLRVRDIEVFRQDGQPVPVRRPTVAPFELTEPEQAFLVGLFQPPQEQEVMKVRVTFDGPGSYRTATEHGLVASARTSIDVLVRPASMRARGHVVVEVDLARSLEAHGVNRVFTPVWRARY
ncbi:hypothetical protein LZ198_10305 [Myxococcus sp. K15C18031901]|uniref:hypothetical protein n=1 Tax=Myxococcus dinghuensis TaxID=2906761 RepID=UPI0020A817FB|nr:hypothetical protein [Myxococcus dinghuensis]MCP3099262.1 hypothetical protein [Myxococcus dinghuensis]